MRERERGRGEVGGAADDWQQQHELCAVLLAISPVCTVSRWQGHLQMRTL